MTVARPVEGARPGAFLRLAGGTCRGLWARGDRWVAHRGALAVMAVHPDHARDRFARIRQHAEALVDPTACRMPADPRLAGRLRFFGGFGFGWDHSPVGVWEGFSAAHFLLPEVELEGDAEGVGRLRMRAPALEGDDVAAVERSLEKRLARLGERLLEGEGTVPAGSSGGRVRCDESDRAAWERAVEEALEGIEAGRFTKVVLARTLDARPAARPDPVEVVKRLWRENRGSHVFLFEPEAGRILVGAAPETVATLRRGVFHATAVAGSTRRGADDEEQQRLAEALLASRKDREEQALVVDDMVERLGPLVDSISVQEEPHVLTLARIQHLETEIRARAPGRHVLELLAALHPTPAVCGVPRDAALEFLRSEEPFERGWYAGPVGWFDVEGNGVFAPALRSAVTRDGRWRLFAGSGIVAGSRPADEWEETGMKFGPVLRALEGGGGS